MIQHSAHVLSPKPNRCWRLCHKALQLAEVSDCRATPTPESAAPRDLILSCVPCAGDPAATGPSAVGGHRNGAGDGRVRAADSELDNEGRYHLLDAAANRLRFPNVHSHYFSLLMLALYSNAKEVCSRAHLSVSAL